MIRGTGLFNHRVLFRFFLLFIVSMLYCSCENRQQQEIGYFREIALNREAPDLSTLVKRATNDTRDKIVMDSFYDLLYLRERPNPSALPELIDVFNHYRDIHGHIMKYAAAQAIYTSRTPGSGPFLMNNLISPYYSAIHGINYAFHHNMQKKERDRFIELYHLVNISNDLQVKTEIKGSASEGYLFKMHFKNSGEKNIELNKAFIRAGFYFKNDTGYSITHPRPFKYMKFKRAIKKNFILKPGEVYIAEFPAKIQDKSVYRKTSYMIPEYSNMVLEIGAYYFPLKKGEKYKVYAMFELMKSDFARHPDQRFKDIWTGRAVSEPVEFTP